MTGELHPEKATVEREVAWGLHFFDETLFEMLPEVMVSLEESLAQYYPDETIAGARPSSSSEAGSAATATATPTSPPASPARPCSATRSPRCGATATASPISAGFSRSPSARCRCRRASAPNSPICWRNPAMPGDRRPQSRRGLSPVPPPACCASSRRPSPAQGRPLGRPGLSERRRLINDLRTLEKGLADAKCGALATDIVRPVRRMVEIFRFSTVRLDSTCARTRPAPLRRCRRSGACATATASRRSSTRPPGRNGCSPSLPGRATRKPRSRISLTGCPTTPARRSQPSPWWARCATPSTARGFRRLQSCR